MSIIRRPAQVALLALILLIAPLAARAQETPALPLTASFTTADGALMFEYPGGWTARDAGRAAVLATSEAALEPGATLPPGEMRADLYAALIVTLPGLDADATLNDVLDVATSAATLGDCEPFDEPVQLAVAGRDVLRAQQTCTGFDNLFIVVAIDDETVGVIGASTLLGGMNKFAATLVEIGATMTYTPPPPPTPAPLSEPLTETYTIADGTVSVRHPDGWNVDDLNGVISITDPNVRYLFLRLRVAGPDLLPPGVERSPEALLNWFVTTAQTSASYDSPEPFQIGALRAARVREQANGYEAMLAIVELEADVYVLLDVSTPPEGMDDVESLVYSIAASVTYDPDAAGSSTVAEPEGAVSLDPTLTETYVASSGQFQLQYPTGWSVSDENGQIILIAPRENFQPSVPQPGEPFAVIQLVSIQRLVGADLPEDVDERVLQGLEVVRSDSQLPYEAPETRRIDGRTLGRMVADVTDFDSAAYLLPLEADIYGLMNVIAASGELADAEPLFLAVLQSITFDTSPSPEPPEEAEPVIPPTPTPAAPVEVNLELTETFTTEDGRLSLGLPSDWQVTDRNGVLTLTNVDELTVVAQDGALNVAQGQFRVLLTIEALSGRSLDEVMEASSEGMEAGDSVTFTAGERAAVRAPVDMRVMSGTLAVADLGDGNAAVITVFHSPDDSDHIEPFLTEFIDSIAVSD